MRLRNFVVQFDLHSNIFKLIPGNLENAVDSNVNLHSNIFKLIPSCFKSSALLFTVFTF